MSILRQEAVGVQRAGCREEENVPHHTPTEENQSLTPLGTLVLVSRMKTGRWSISLAIVQTLQVVNGMNLTGEGLRALT